MNRFLEMSTPRNGLRIAAILTIVAIIGTHAIAQLLSYLLSSPSTWQQYVMRGVIPLFVTPMVVLPLIAMNIRLNTLRAEMDELARTDALTGLPNRRAFFKRAKEIFALLRGHEPAAVLMIDIDRFKSINDTFGHDAGDALLRAVAKTIVAVSAEQGADRALAARIGGEEFAVVIDRFGAAEATALAALICERVRGDITTHHGKQLAATVSIGIALRRDVQPIDVVLKAADTAVYQAKESGRDRWCMATDDMIDLGKGASHELRAQPRAA